MTRAVASLLACAALACLAGSSFAAEPDVTKTAKSGRWSEGSTWASGKVPAAGARVHILPGHVVAYDVASDDVIRAINVAGTLSFARDRDTRLNVGLIKIQRTTTYSDEGFDCDAHDAHKTLGDRATLEVGSPNDPIPAKFTATIRLHAVEGLDKNSCPAIVCCGGQMDFHGAPLSRAWVKLGATVAKGASDLTLAEAVTGWKVGDRILVTATDDDDSGGSTLRPGKTSETAQSEERILKAIDGTKLTFDKPLTFAHIAEGRKVGEVANLSRNVVVESADPKGVRGHTMYHEGSAGAISYAEFRHLGKENVLGRYAIHFHKGGNSMRGSYVVGASIWDSHNRWLTVHGTNYLLIKDNVGYQSVGHGFFFEDGTEIYSVIDRNLAVQSYHAKPLPKQVLPFDGNEGSGFWWANSLNTFTNNVAVENDRYGYRFEATQSSSFKIDSPIVMKPDGSFAATDIRTLPFVRFEGNESHCNGLYGFNIGEGVRRVGPDSKHPFIVKDTNIWHEHYCFRVQSPSMLVENMHMEDSVYGVYHPNFDRHVYRNWEVFNVEAEPFNRGHDDDSIQYGVLTVDGLAFKSKYYGDGMPFIQMSDDNPDGAAVSHFRNVKVLNRPESKRGKALVNLGGGPRPTPKSEHGVIYYLHDWYGPGRTAKVVSTKAKAELADGSQYKSDPPLTGDESRVAEVSEVPFPQPLDPVDDLPPATVITSVKSLSKDRAIVRGIVSDNGVVKKVTVNGQPAKLDAATGTWEIELPRVADHLPLTAFSEDAAGNIEKLPHEMVAE